MIFKASVHIAGQSCKITNTLLHKDFPINDLVHIEDRKGNSADINALVLINCLNALANGRKVSIEEYVKQLIDGLE